MGEKRNKPKSNHRKQPSTETTTMRTQVSLSGRTRARAPYKYLGATRYARTYREYLGLGIGLHIVGPMAQRRPPPFSAVLTQRISAFFDELGLPESDVIIDQIMALQSTDSLEGYTQIRLLSLAETQRLMKIKKERQELSQQVGHERRCLTTLRVGRKRSAQIGHGMEMRAKKCEREIQIQETRARQVERELAAATEKLDIATAAHRARASDVDALQREIAQLTLTRDQRVERVAVLDQRLELMDGAVDASKRQLDAINDRIQQQTTVLATRIKQISAAKAELEQLTMTRDKRRGEITTAENKLQQLSQSHEDRVQEMAALKEELEQKVQVECKATAARSG